MKLITRFVARKTRKELIDVERQMNELVALVDRFYSVLGPRNWVFPDQLNTTDLGALSQLPPEDAERSLIELYRYSHTLRVLVMRLRRFPELQQRMPLLERALADYAEGRFYGTVHLLLSVMDGFVNDVDKEQRRGLHARDTDEMSAWDSVVGHHLGLAHAHATFIKGFRKTSNDEAFELFRNGIVHGMLTSYDNVVVATKAWNRLFAVADWADSRKKQLAPAPKSQGWRELLRTLVDSKRAKDALEQWRPSSLHAGESGFEEDEVVVATSAYLGAWRSRNFGKMAELISPMLVGGTREKIAGLVRNEMPGSVLDAFKVESVEHSAAAGALVNVSLTINGHATPGRLRWIRQDDQGQSVAPNQLGSWRLMNWEPLSLLDRGATAGSLKS